MSIFDGVLKRIGSAPDSVAHLAAKAGIDLAMAEIAIEALVQSYLNRPEIAGGALA